jgi:Tol biopolymer transport system component
MRSAALVVGALAAFVACIGDDPSSGAPTPAIDGGRSDSSVSPGAPDGGARCDPTKPFQDIALVTNVNTDKHESGGTLTPDELTLIFSSNRSGENDIYQATRAKRTDDFSAPVPLADVNMNGGDDQSPSMTADGKTLYLRSNRSGTNGFNDIFVATRGSAGAQFSGFGPAQNINGAGDDVDPKINGPGTRLTYASNKAGGGGGAYDLWEAPVNGGNVGSGKPLTELNSPGFEAHAVLTDDALTVYYQSDRTAPPGGKGALDIWVARRASLTAPFENLQNLAEVNSTADDVPMWISPDGCVLYFASSRPGIGARDLYSATRGR